MPYTQLLGPLCLELNAAPRGIQSPIDRISVLAPRGAGPKARQIPGHRGPAVSSSPTLLWAT